MSRAASYPHLHDDKVADTIQHFTPATQFSSHNTGTQAAGTRPYMGSAAVHAVQVVESTYPSRRPDATTGVGSACTALWLVPDDLGVGAATDFRVWWTTSLADAAATATWTVTYSSLASGSALADATTALNTTIAASAATATAWSANVTAWGTANAATLANGRILALKVDLTALATLSATTDQIHFLGLEIRYTRRFI